MYYTTNKCHFYRHFGYKVSVPVSEVITGNSREHDLPCLVPCRGMETSDSHLHLKHIMQSKPISEYNLLEQVR